jgi:uncharacterized membrane protein YadS
MQKYLPGLGLCLAIALVAALIAGIQGVFPGIVGLKILGILGWALVLGIVVRSSLVVPAGLKSGIEFLESGEFWFVDCAA